MQVIECRNIGRKQGLRTESNKQAVTMALLAQINTNHLGYAQDLMIQTARELGISLVAISEPHSVPSTQMWTKDLSGTAAIYVPGSIE